MSAWQKLPPRNRYCLCFLIVLCPPVGLFYLRIVLENIDKDLDDDDPCTELGALVFQPLVATLFWLFAFIPGILYAFLVIWMCDGGTEFTHPGCIAGCNKCCDGCGTCCGKCFCIPDDKEAEGPKTTEMV